MCNNVRRGFNEAAKWVFGLRKVFELTCAQKLRYASELTDPNASIHKS